MLNPGSRLSTGVFPLRTSEYIEHQTRIEDPQPPEANYAVTVRPICVRLKDVSVATTKVAVAAGGSASGVVSCPKGKLVVGGGFQFPAENEETSPRPRRASSATAGCTRRPTHRLPVSPRAAR